MLTRHGSLPASTAQKPLASRKCVDERARNDNFGKQAPCARDIARRRCRLHLAAAAAVTRQSIAKRQRVAAAKKRFHV